jgi:protein-L-isoaspartate(D-aspartate) O-methyltransferase
MPTLKDYTRKRNRMVDEQLIAQGINDRRVLDAMRSIPRHEFVESAYQQFAYDDTPLPIGESQTISQPYMVAFMTERLRVKPNDTVLEIGTGSGYQTAILSKLVDYIYSLERSSRLADIAGQRLSEMGYSNVDIHIGDGSQGLADMSPYDAILVAAAAPKVPGVLCSQLKYNGGRMIIPVGDRLQQELQLIVRRGDKIHTRTLLLCKFVPLIGRYGFRPGHQDTSSLV